MSPQPTVLPPGAGDSFWIVGDLITFKLGPDQTAGKYAFADTVVPPGGGPPPHVHLREDEMFYLLEGQLRFTFGDTTFLGSAGDAVYLPRGIVHTFHNVGVTPARFVVATTPAGFRRFIPDAGVACTDPSAVPPPVTSDAIARLLAAAAKHGLELRPEHVASRVADPRPADPQYWVLGLHVRIKLTSADTAGHFSLAEVTCQPGQGVPPHTHQTQDEMFYVRQGTFEFEIDGRAYRAPAGTFVHVPPQTLHAFRNVGDSAGVLVNYHAPGGFEHFFEECGVAYTPNAAPPPEPTEADFPRIARLMEKHGMTVPMPAGV